MTTVEPADPTPFVAADFPAAPLAQCDVVMKGGITSGVIYPLAVCELARTYRLRSVGGASAGAIAAAVAAAAELGRRTSSAEEAAAAATSTAPVDWMPGPAPQSGEPVNENAKVVLPRGYPGLSLFPKLLTEPQSDQQSLLLHLFRPQPEARRLFGLVTGAIAKTSKLRKDPPTPLVLKTVVELAIGLAKRTPGRTLVGALPGLLLVALSVLALLEQPTATGVLGVVLMVALVLAVLVSLVVTALGALIGSITGLMKDLWALPKIDFGLSSGRGANDHELALTPWLDRRLQELSGKAYDQPLTMGDLWQQEIKFQAMTTNLSRAQPMVMPWDDHTYFFEPDEFEALFGQPVVDAMRAEEAVPAQPSDPKQAERWKLLMANRGTKEPFPRAEHLPVIVATRMSLSFPLLISAVPLYTVDWEHPANQQFAAAAKTGGGSDSLDWDVNWFSDGGLTSNLPVQFFDSQLPTRPTFAINLAPFEDAARLRDEDELNNSALPESDVAGQELPRRTARWTSKQPMGQLASFGIALVNTARTWVDEASLVMPGYRDRVVTVFQEEKTEGGLNLSMDKPTVDRLSLRGRFAAQRLVRHFGSADGWPNHRWIRFRTATAALSDWLAGFEQGYVDDPAFYTARLADRARQTAYPMDEAHRAAAQSRIAGLRTEIAKWAVSPADAFTAGRPLQPPVLRLVPPTNEAEGSAPMSRLSPGGDAAS